MAGPYRLVSCLQAMAPPARTPPRAPATATTATRKTVPVPSPAVDPVIPVADGDHGALHPGVHQSDDSKPVPHTAACRTRLPRGCRVAEAERGAADGERERDDGAQGRGELRQRRRAQRYGVGGKRRWERENRERALDASKQLRRLLLCRKMTYDRGYESWGKGPGRERKWM
jgi:hypothetical protein